MTLTMEAEDLLMCLLRGNLFDCATLPIDVGDKLKLQDPEGKVFVLNRPSPSAQYYELWTVDGWKNEQRRQLYVVQLGPLAPEDYFVPGKEQSPKKKQSLQDELQAAIEAGDVSKVFSIRAKLSTAPKEEEKPMTQDEIKKAIMEAVAGGDLDLVEKLQKKLIKSDDKK